MASLQIWPVLDASSQCYIDNMYFPLGPCDEDSQFDCGDETCIDRSLKCNDQINCNFSWDEMECEKPEEEGIKTR